MAFKGHSITICLRMLVLCLILVNTLHIHCIYIMCTLIYRYMFIAAHPAKAERGRSVPALANFAKSATPFVILVPFLESHASVDLEEPF